MTADDINDKNGFRRLGKGYGSQCVYATIEQYFSPLDLNIFMLEHLPNDTWAEDFDIPEERQIGGHVSDEVCYEDYHSCIEGQLDVEYMMSTAPGIDTWWIYNSETQFVLGFTNTLLSMQDTPLVNSISYGVEEAKVSRAVVNAFNNNMIMLSARGVTLLAGSGDDGAPGFNARKDASKCKYEAMFPASSPYVLAIGGTQGPESNTPEVACSTEWHSQGDTSSITTGGGFSALHKAPKYQRSQIAKYFSTVSPKPVAGYNATGRGYPDISALAKDYSVRIGA